MHLRQLRERFLGPMHEDVQWRGWREQEDTLLYQTNFLQETIDTLIQNGHSFEDILYVENSGELIDRQTFHIVADIWYDNDYGIEDISENLRVVGKDWWLERHQWDGKEWWEYKSLPEQPEIQLILTDV